MMVIDSMVVGTVLVDVGVAGQCCLPKKFVEV
jgi:hypothetical protein